MPRDPSRVPYRTAQATSRARVGSIGVTAAERIKETVDQYADELARRVAQLPAGSNLAVRLQASERIFRSLSAKFQTTLAGAVKQNRALAFNEVQAVWAEASRQVAAVQGIPTALLGAIEAPPFTMLGAYESLGAAHWRTLLAASTQSAILEANTIVRMGLTQQVDMRALAQRLRPYVKGSETFESAFDRFGFRKVDIPAQQRGAAKRMLFNARRIAVSEIHNARAEAEVQHFFNDPLIDGVAWRLAPDRGPTAKVDECNVFAHSDLYGLGEGIYPVDSVPLTPHPFDRCERVPNVRPVADAAKPKRLGLPRRSAASSGTTGVKGVSAADAKRAKAKAEQVLKATPRLGERTVAAPVATPAVPPPRVRRTPVRKKPARATSPKVQKPVVPVVPEVPEKLRFKVPLRGPEADTLNQRLEFAKKFVADNRAVDSAQEFMKWGQELGINVRVAKGTPVHVMNNVARGMSEFVARGYDVPKSVMVWDATASGVVDRGTVAYYSASLGDDALLGINLRSSNWGRTAEQFIEGKKAEAGQGWFHSYSPLSTIRHEIGHHLHMRNFGLEEVLRQGKGSSKRLRNRLARAVIKAFNLKKGPDALTLDELRRKALKIVRREVSGYAATEPSELIAEMWSGLVEGKKYSEGMMSAYRALGGPEWVGEALPAAAQNAAKGF